MTPEEEAAAQAAADKAASDKAAADAAAAADEANKPPAKVEFTPEQQAHIDDLIKKNTGKSKAAAEKDFKTWLDQQAMSDNDRLKAEKADADKALADARAEVLTTKVETAAERFAIAAGIKADRVSKFMRLVDLDIEALSDDGKPDTDAIKKLVEAEVAANPEFKGGAAPAGASGAEGFNSADGKVWTKAEVAKLSVDEFEKHETEIMKQLQGAGIK